MRTFFQASLLFLATATASGSAGAVTFDRDRSELGLDAMAAQPLHDHNMRVRLLDYDGSLSGTLR